MLALPRPRNLLHALRSPPIRSLTSIPPKIPPHVNIWDPTRYTPDNSQETQPESSNDGDGDGDIIRRTDRKMLRDTQRLELSNMKCTHRSSRRLRRLLLHSNEKSNRDLKLYVALWQHYKLAKKNSISILRYLPQRAWDILWTAHAALSHLSRESQKKLYLDLYNARMPFTVGERIKYYESLYRNGKKKEAMIEWDYDHNYEQCSRRRHDFKPEHLEVGVKLHALAGNVDRAQKIMEQLFELYPSWDPSVMMIVFRAHTNLKLERHTHAARELYVKMKDRLGKSSSLEHYDSWFVGFLQAQNIHHAKQVFTDMVKDGKIGRFLTPKEVYDTLKRLHLLYRLGSDISKVTSIALHAITVLPSHYHSYIYGDWMKKALAQTTPEAAVQIIDMMFQQGGYKPQTYHFNLLLRALFRSEEKPHNLKAENIGWRMVDESSKLSQKPPRVQLHEDIAIKAELGSDIDHTTDVEMKYPPASATTFALMMKYHGKDSQWEHVDYLERQLKKSHVYPNATLLNVLMDHKCRQGKYSEGFRTYQALTEVSEGSEAVFPDGTSLRLLWQTLRFALEDHDARSDKSLPTPQEVLTETVRWWKLCRYRPDAQRFLRGLSAQNHRAISKLMMHCFSYTQDLPGSLIALHILSKDFGIFPDEEAAEILQKQIAWVDMPPGKRHGPLSHRMNKLYRQNTEKMGLVYSMLFERRLSRMKITEDKYDQLGDDEAKEIRLNLLSEFIRVILKRNNPPRNVEGMIDAAKEKVGVANMSTGDLTAFQVA